MQVNADITIYNKISGTEQYQRTQISDVVWENRKVVNVIQSGLLSADQATIYIPFKRGENYLAPKTWQALITKTGRWTLQVGDFIVNGLITDEIGTGFTITALKKKYDDVLIIKSVDTMNMGSAAMRHWQLGCG